MSAQRSLCEAHRLWQFDVRHEKHSWTCHNYTVTYCRLSVATFACRHLSDLELGSYFYGRFMPCIAVIYLYSFASWVWPRFWAISSAATNRIKKHPAGNKSGITCSTKMTNDGLAGFIRSGAGKQNVFFSFCLSRFDCTDDMTR